jgi:hypothetical protein
MKGKKNTLINRKENEVELLYNIRKIFVDLSKPKTIKQTKLVEMYSNIFINMIFYKCRYLDKTEEFIKKFLLKNKNKIKKYITHVDF